MSFICMYLGERFLLLISSSSARRVATAAEVSHSMRMGPAEPAGRRDTEFFRCTVQIWGLLLA